MTLPGPRTHGQSAFTQKSTIGSEVNRASGLASLRDGPRAGRTRVVRHQGARVSRCVGAESPGSTCRGQSAAGCSISPPAPGPASGQARRRDVYGSTFSITVCATPSIRLPCPDSAQRRHFLIGNLTSDSQEPSQVAMLRRRSRSSNPRERQKSLKYARPLP